MVDPIIIGELAEPAVGVAAISGMTEPPDTVADPVV